MNKEEKRKIPIKNYVILGFIAVITVILTLYINAWIKTYKVNKEDNNPLDDGVVQQVTINELDVTLAEVNQVILYVGDGSDSELDDDILKRINKDSLNDYFYYLNVTGEEKEYISEIRKSFPSVKGEINVAPMFIYIKNGEVVKVIDSEEHELNINDLNIIIDNYVIE